MENSIADAYVIGEKTFVPYIVKDEKTHVDILLDLVKRKLRPATFEEYVEFLSKFPNETKIHNFRFGFSDPPRFGEKTYKYRTLTVEV